MKSIQYLWARLQEGSSMTAIGMAFLVTYFNLPEEMVGEIWAWGLQGLGYLGLMGGVMKPDAGSE